MKNIEIERKFLVVELDMKALKLLNESVLNGGVDIIQGYLSVSPMMAIRIRIEKPRENKEDAFLTIKHKLEPDKDTERMEYTYRISAKEAKILLGLRGDGPRIYRYNLIRKTRFRLKRFEIDVFHGSLNGLVLAEIELKSSDERIIRPIGFSLREVTGDHNFKNSSLIKLKSLPKGKNWGWSISP